MISAPKETRSSRNERSTASHLGTRWPIRNRLNGVSSADSRMATTNGMTISPIRASRATKPSRTIAIAMIRQEKPPARRTPNGIAPSASRTVT